MDYKRNEGKVTKTEPIGILDEILKYKNGWIRQFTEWKDAFPKLLKYYKPRGLRHQGRP
jgi:hypothetical protein